MQNFLYTCIIFNVITILEDKCKKCVLHYICSWNSNTYKHFKN